MKVNLYYAPYPSQIFEGETDPVNTERPFNPRSALPTLAAGLRAFCASNGLSCEIEIVDLQLGSQRVPYKSIPYGPRIMNCYRYGVPFEEAAEKIREADVHGITCNFTNSAQIVADLARFIKQVKPGTTVVVGGVDCTARPEYYLRRGVDVVVLGEGEHVFGRVVEAVANRRGLDDIPNICTADRPTATRIDMSALVNLDELEPMALDLVGDLSLFDDTAEGPPPAGVHGNFICWETSRGCAWRCSFCSAPSRGHYRYMSAEAMDRHLKYFRSLGVRTIVWQEDNPLSRIQRKGTGDYLYERGREELLQMFDLIRGHGFAWEFANGIEFGKFMQDGRFDHELAAALLDSTVTDEGWVGCYRVQIPLDNMNIKKKRFPKLLGVDEQVDILATMLTDHGVGHQTYDLFIGYPEHDPEGIDLFGDYCLRIKSELSALGGSTYQPYFNVFNLALLPGATDYTSLRSLLAFDIEEHPELVGIFLSAVETDHFSYWDIYQKRLHMTNLLNDRELHRRYDGIYAG
ncbi:B12-binding domain-containing radical SAM protein [Candidatus Protofrankia datiscae]|uniref:Cobalamin B12-binding domain protein n=2 Tax=Protofrankia TaxID=2994361 RepID=F8AVY2_9ACTN|nr:B12-binding domain-containing radical SAM protein [Candidatus Protofrankia datiscae]AEH09303.1 cobalamin B12-binding domain protein [Candidatus Protofrankia datiscae]